MLLETCPRSCTLVPVSKLERKDVEVVLRVLNLSVHLLFMKFCYYIHSLIFVSLLHIC